METKETKKRADKPVQLAIAKLPGRRYEEDKPGDCRYCYYWAGRIRGCSRKECWYLIPLPEKPKKEPRRPLTPKPEYKSRFEDFADASRKEEAKPETKRRKKKDDEDRRVRAEDLEKKEYDEKFKPVYSDEELEEIEAREMEEEENSWINDDDIDFDEYEDYYRED